jgi:hypothetical protein
MKFGEFPSSRRAPALTLPRPGKALRRQAAGAWLSYYINYKRLKAELKKARQTVRGAPCRHGRRANADLRQAPRARR